MIQCEHCKKEYATESAMLKDCFVSSDGWSWDYFHNCLKGKGLEIHGYLPPKEKEALEINSESCIHANLQYYNHGYHAICEDCGEKTY